MKLHHLIAPPFVHKVMAAAIDYGVDRKLTLLPTNSRQSTPEPTAANPFSKIPLSELGNLSFTVALDCLDFRFSSDGWRQGCPRLAGWHERYSRCNSSKATMPAERVAEESGIKQVDSSPRLAGEDFQ